MESLGLAAPRRKTKYDIDPRNNAWANDDNKFGQKLMEKFGWEKGKGLGAQEDGETENIKVKVKNDKHGIGANNDYSDTWLDHQDDFNSILASLNTCHSAPGSGTATPTNEPSTEAVAGSMEERSKSSKSRVHYKKFTQGKDLTRADASDLDALFGRRKKFEKRSRKLKKAAQSGVKSEPASPLGAMTPVGGNSPRKDDAIPASDIKEEDGDKEYDASGNLRTVTSSMSVSDYFAKKMAEIKAKRNAEAGGAAAAPSAIDTFCENSIRRTQEDTKPEVKEEVKSDDPQEEDKPEVYRQEKFQAATLSVQQYFEQKMKEKKARAEAAAAVAAVDANGGDVKLETEKSAEEITEEPKKKKKKKAKNLEPVLTKPSSEDDKNNNATTEEESVKPKEKKKKKKLKMEEKPAENESFPQTDSGEKPKKKKKKKKTENLGSEINTDSGKLEAAQPVVKIVEDAGKEVENSEKRKKRKRKLDCASESETLQEPCSVSEDGDKEKEKEEKMPGQYRLIASHVDLGLL